MKIIKDRDQVIYYFDGQHDLEENEEILSRAIYELGDLGKSASAAIEPLQAIAQETDSREVKTAANDALQKIQ